jgi:hypothetical protein
VPAAIIEIADVGDDERTIVGGHRCSGLDETVRGEGVGVVEKLMEEKRVLGAGTGALGPVTFLLGGGTGTSSSQLVSSEHVGTFGSGRSKPTNADFSTCSLDVDFSTASRDFRCTCITSDWNIS